MKLIINIISTIISAYILSLLLPWWAIVLAGLLVGLFIKSKTTSSFLGGFLGGILLWGIMAFWLNTGNEGILAERIGVLFGGIGENGILMVTAVFGGLLAGLGALTGNLGRKLMK